MDNPDLHDYLDFRKYLQDIYLYRKHVNQRISYQILALKFNLGSRSHLYDIIHGRTLTSRYLPRYLEMLSLSGQDAEYFKALVDFRAWIEIPLSQLQWMHYGFPTETNLDATLFYGMDLNFGTGSQSLVKIRSLRWE